MGGIDLNKYLTDIPEYTTGRLRYNPVNMLKTVLFGFHRRLQVWSKRKQVYLGMEESYRKVPLQALWKITAEIEEINAEIAWSGVQITTNSEYVPDYLNEIVEQLVLLWELDSSTFVYGSGKRKSKEQRHYEHLTTFCQKLQEYIQKIEICGPNRNSYSKTDNSATFMRIKTDYMGNDQLLPALMYRLV